MRCRSRRYGSTASTITIIPAADRRRARDLCEPCWSSGSNGDIYAQLAVTELGAIANKMVDAAAMATGLGETGHIALYGIYFDTDKAVVKPGADRRWTRSPSFCASQPELKVIHRRTYRQPGRLYDYNMELSRRRAAAVAADLTAQLPGSRPSVCSPRASAISRRSARTPAPTAARSTGVWSWWRRSFNARA